MSEYECGYCNGAVVESNAGGYYVHADAGQRIKNISPGDFVSARHNKAGTKVDPVDVVEREGEST